MIVSAYLRVILSGVRPRSCHRYARHCYAVRLRALARRSAQDDTGGRSRNPQGARLAGGSRAWSEYKTFRCYNVVGAIHESPAKPSWGLSGTLNAPHKIAFPSGVCPRLRRARMPSPAESALALWRACMPSPAGKVAAACRLTDEENAFCAVLAGSPHPPPLRLWSPFPAGEGKRTFCLAALCGANISRTVREAGPYRVWR